MNTQTIEIDCPPGSPRPGDLISSVVSGTGLPEDGLDDRIELKFMGNWQWGFHDVDECIWQAARETIKERLTELYNSGRCRYASW